jgi:hypothetical protein
MGKTPTGREGTGGPTMSQPTQPEDLGQVAHYRGSLKDSQCFNLVK